MAALSATEAAEVLDRLGDHEQALTERTAGMTNLVWGLASALIFLTYSTASDALVRNGIEWAFALLWIPGVLLGSALTYALWNSHAVTLRVQADAGREGLRFLFSIAVFFVLAAVIHFGAQAAGADWNVSSSMTVVNGAFALVVARMHRHTSARCGRMTIWGGVWMMAAGVCLGFADLWYDTTALLGAGATAVGWGGAGLATYLRG